MPVELRKRKAPAPPPEPPAPKKTTKTSKVSKAAPKVKAAVAAKAEKPAAKANGKTSTGKPPAVGDVIALDGFGGEIETNDGESTTLKDLVDESKAGVVLFTYPKASTPGCTNQVCLFRDNYTPFTAGGLAIYGLSTDSPKANTTFKDKQKLPYPLLCDPAATLIAAIGLKKQPKGTQRGVFVVNKDGKVLLAEPGSPAGTVAAVKKLVESTDGAAAAEEEDKPEEKAEEKAEEETEEKADDKTEDEAEPAEEDAKEKAEEANGEEKE